MIFFILLLILLIVLYKFFTKNNDHWLRKGVPYKKPYPFFGNLLHVFLKKETFQSTLIKMYKEGEGHRYFGIFNLTKPLLLIRDPKVISAVLKSDFSKFTSKGLLVDHKRDPTSVNLVFMEGHLWKRSRALLRPGFKSGRLRSLVPMIEKIAKNMFKEKQQKFSLEMKAAAKRFSAAVIAGPVFGIELNEAIVDLFVQNCDQAFNVQGWRGIPVLMRLILPKIALLFGMKLLPEATEQFFIDITRSVKLGRKDDLLREDFIQTIITAISGLAAYNPDRDFLDAALIGQFFAFVIGGYDTTASVTCHALYLLAQHQDVCDTARREILDVMQGKKDNFTYDHLKQMKYLENIINETMRIYPPIPTLVRVCSETYRIQGSDVILEPGDFIQIPIVCVHNDPLYFENPEEFRPSRFDTPFIEGTFLPLLQMDQGIV